MNLFDEVRAKRIEIRTRQQPALNHQVQTLAAMIRNWPMEHRACLYSSLTWDGASQEQKATLSKMYGFTTAEIAMAAALSPEDIERIKADMGRTLLATSPLFIV